MTKEDTGGIFSQMQDEPRTIAVEPHSEPVEPQKLKVTITEAESPYPRGPFTSGTPVAYKPPEPVAYKPPKKGVRTGLKQGETRVTCIFTEEQNQVLHDWCKTTGRTFREVCLAMATHYIDTVIREAANEGLHLRRGAKEPPEAYADLYGDMPDLWAKFFK